MYWQVLKSKESLSTLTNDISIDDSDDDDDDDDEGKDDNGIDTNPKKCLALSDSEGNNILLLRNKSVIHHL